MVVCLSNKAWNPISSHFEVTLGDFSGIRTAFSNLFVLSFKMSLGLSLPVKSWLLTTGTFKWKRNFICFRNKSHMHSKENFLWTYQSASHVGKNSDITKSTWWLALCWKYWCWIFNTWQMRKIFVWSDLYTYSQNFFRKAKWATYCFTVTLRYNTCICLLEISWKAEELWESEKQTLYFFFPVLGSEDIIAKNCRQPVHLHLKQLVQSLPPASALLGFMVEEGVVLHQNERKNRITKSS